MNAKMKESLTYEDIGHLLNAKGDKLVEGEDDPEDVIREVIQILARAESTRSREKAVDSAGRVSFGRDLHGVYGMSLFHPDARGREADSDD